MILRCKSRPSVRGGSSWNKASRDCRQRLGQILPRTLVKVARLVSDRRKALYDPPHRPTITGSPVPRLTFPWPWCKHRIPSSLRTKARKLFSLIVELLIAGGLSPAIAQVSSGCPPQGPQATIAYSQRLTGCSLSQASAQDLYAFAPAANDLVRISLWKEGGQGTPCVEVFDPSGALAGGQGCLTDFSLTMTQSGNYKIVVQAQRAIGVFQYDLRLDRIFPISPTSTAIGIGDMQADQSSYLGQYNLYHFTGLQGQVMWMDMTQRGGPGVPCIQIYGPNRDRIFGPYCTNGGLTPPYNYGPAYFTLPLNATGTYVISVNDQADAQLVQYQLRLERIVPTVPTAHALQYGGTVQGQVGPFGKMDVVYFDGTKGDYVSSGITTTSELVGGSFFDAGGSLVFGQLEFGGDEGLVYILPATGRYVWLLSGPNDDNQLFTYANDRTAPYTVFATCSGQCLSASSSPVGTLSAFPPTLSFQVVQGTKAVIAQALQVSGPSPDAQLLITPVDRKSTRLN